MAAEIKPITSRDGGAAPGHKPLTCEKPVLMSKIDSSGDEIYGVRILAQGQSILSIGGDKAVKIWQQRANGQYWPSVCHFLPAAPTSMHYTEDSRTLCLGLTNGTVMEFEVASDMNSLNHLRDYLSHQGRVTSILFSALYGWLLSISRDKFFCFHSTTTGHRLGGYECNGWCTSMTFDEPSCHAFVGDNSGAISMLKLDSGSCKLITVLRGHSSNVESLAWDGVAQHLFSCSYDQLVMVWDIGGGQGTSYELQGHTNRARCLYHCPQRKVLVSGGEDSQIIWWDLAASRVPTPEWSESDVCQYCSRPFFWNFKAMYNQKQIGLRQHHCRKCGKAVCDQCSQRRTNLPAMGFEMNVRVCEKCYETITDKDRESLAVFQEAKHPVTAMDVDLAAGVLLTVGTDNVIKIWDIKPLLSSSST